MKKERFAILLIFCLLLSINIVVTQERSAVGLILTPSAAKITEGDGVIQLRAELLYDDGSLADVSDSALWNSATVNGLLVVSVNNRGLVTRAGEGTATITAVYSGFSAKAVITVDVPAYLPPEDMADEVVALRSRGDLIRRLNLGNTAQLQLYEVSRLTGDKGSVSSRSVRWTSDNANVASVNNGLITARGNGIAKIMADGSTGQLSIEPAVVYVVVGSQMTAGPGTGVVPPSGSGAAGAGGSVPVSDQEIVPIPPPPLQEQCNIDSYLLTCHNCYQAIFRPGEFQRILEQSQLAPHCITPFKNRCLTDTPFKETLALNMVNSIINKNQPLPEESLVCGAGTIAAEGPGAGTEEEPSAEPAEPEPQCFINNNPIYGPYDLSIFPGGSQKANAPEMVDSGLFLNDAYYFTVGENVLRLSRAGNSWQWGDAGTVNDLLRAIPRAESALDFLPAPLRDFIASIAQGSTTLDAIEFIDGRFILTNDERFWTVLNGQYEFVNADIAPFLQDITGVPTPFARVDAMAHNNHGTLMFFVNNADSTNVYWWNDAGNEWQSVNLNDITNGCFNHPIDAALTDGNAIVLFSEDKYWFMNSPLQQAAAVVTTAGSGGETSAGGGAAAGSGEETSASVETTPASGGAINEDLGCPLTPSCSQTMDWQAECNNQDGRNRHPECDEVQDNVKYWRFSILNPSASKDGRSVEDIPGAPIDPAKVAFDTLRFTGNGRLWFVDRDYQGCNGRSFHIGFAPGYDKAQLMSKLSGGRNAGQLYADYYYGNRRGLATAKTGPMPLADFSQAIYEISSANRELWQSYTGGNGESPFTYTTEVLVHNVETTGDISKLAYADSPEISWEANYYDDINAVLNGRVAKSSLSTRFFPMTYGPTVFDVQASDSYTLMSVIDAEPLQNCESTDIIIATTGIDEVMYDNQGLEQIRPPDYPSQNCNNNLACEHGENVVTCGDCGFRPGYADDMAYCNYDGVCTANEFNLGNPCVEWQTDCGSTLEWFAYPAVEQETYNGLRFKTHEMNMLRDYLDALQYGSPVYNLMSSPITRLDYFTKHIGYVPNKNPDLAGYNKYIDAVFTNNLQQEALSDSTVSGPRYEKAFKVDYFQGYPTGMSITQRSPILRFYIERMGRNGIRPTMVDARYNKQTYRTEIGWVDLYGVMHSFDDLATMNTDTNAGTMGDLFGRERLLALLVENGVDVSQMPDTSSLQEFSYVFENVFEDMGSAFANIEATQREIDAKAESDLVLNLMGGSYMTIPMPMSDPGAQSDLEGIQ